MHQVEYLLKHILNSSTLRLENIKEVSDSACIQSFKRRHGSVNTHKLFTNDGITFPMFNIPLSKGTFHKVVFCEVAVGDSLYVTKEYSKTLNPPSAYNSFIIDHRNDRFNLLVDEEHIDSCNYSYVLKDQSRILPLYEVTFEYDEELERKSKGAFICDRCKREQSVSFCPSERANFCEKCDEEVHVDEFHKRHERYYFNQVGKRRFIYCSIHPETMVDYFCMECVIPICTKCKISGNHSESPNSAHGLIKYIDACDRLKENVTSKNEELTITMEHLVQSIEVYRSNCNIWKEKVSSIRQRIIDEYKYIMNELDLYENSQYQILNASYIGGICKLENMERMKEYSASLEPSQLVRSYRLLTQQRDEVLLENDVQFAAKNIELRGKLTLGSPAELAIRQAQSPRMQKTTKMYVETRGSKKDHY